MYDTIIIGGGIAGLYYAYKSRKLEPSKNILLLEANDHLGGRAGNVDFHGQSIAIGAGIGRKKKDKLLLALVTELNIPFYEFSASSQYSETIGPACKVKEMFLYLKKHYSVKNDKKKTFKQYAKPILESKYGQDAYKNFTVCAGYTDYENECAYDTFYYYGFDDNYNDFTGFGFSWNKLVLAMASQIGSQHIRKSCSVNSINSISNNEYQLVCKDKQYSCEHVVIATTIESLQKLLPKNHIYSQIKGQHFMRVYGKFSHSSILIMKEKCSSSTIVPGPLHKIIPINVDKGIYMIVYTDNKGAFILEKHKENTKKNRDILCRLLEVALNITVNSLELEDIVSFYWSIGTHYYTPLRGEFKDRVEFCNAAQRPENNIRVIGEMISMKQGWVEGALESVENIL